MSDRIKNHSSIPSIGSVLAGLREHLAVWNNPIVWKNYQSRMRIQAVFSFLLVFVLAAFMTFTTYGGLMRVQGDPLIAARTAIAPLAMLQWFIMMLFATWRITSGIIHERVTGTIEYTRLTPLHPLHKVIGNLFGLPVREYLLFLLTMPFMVFLLVVGEIPVSVVLHVYLVFFTSVLLFHSVGMVLGLVLKEWRLSVMFTTALVVTINWILPSFTYLGFPFLQYITVWPVFDEKISPLLPSQNLPQMDEVPTLITDLTAGVDFYTWEISTTVFCVILQSLLIFTLALMVYRKWENNFGHSLSKSYGMFFYIALQVVCIGTLWPNLTNTTNLIFSTEFLDDSAVEQLAFVIPLIYAFFSIAVACWLAYVVSPNHDDFRAGLLRSRKLEQVSNKPLSRFDDLASGFPTYTILALCTFGFILAVEMVMAQMGPLSNVAPDTLGLLRLPVIAMLVILHFGIALEYLQVRKFALLLLMVWIVPILLAVFLAAALELEDEALYIASGSPISMVTLASQGLVDSGLDEEWIAVLDNAYRIGGVFILCVTLFLGVRLHQFRHQVRQTVLAQ